MIRSIALLMAFALPAPELFAVQDAAPAGPSDGQRISYGENDLQFGVLRLPDGPGPFPLVVGIHGGCWLDSLGEGSLAPVAQALVEEGIATWDIEYRRLGHDGGGWPGTFHDVAAAIDHVGALAEEHPLDLDRVVLIGHSSGAQLAVWAAGRPWLPEDSPVRGSSPLRVSGAVGIDGPMDLAGFADAGHDTTVCGRPVISELLGGSPDDYPQRYRDTSPFEMPAMDVDIYLTPAELVLSLSDPEIMSTRAAETGERVWVVSVPESNHFQLITPSHATWQPVLETIKSALGLR